MATFFDWLVPKWSRLKHQMHYQYSSHNPVKNNISSTFRYWLKCIMLSSYAKFFGGCSSIELFLASLIRTCSWSKVWGKLHMDFVGTRQFLRCKQLSWCYILKFPRDLPLPVGRSSRVNHQNLAPKFLLQDHAFFHIKQ